MNIGLIAALASLAAGCGAVSVSQIPLQKNVWQIQTEGFDTGIVSVDAVLTRRAAELTVAQGYDSFVIRNSQAQLVAGYNDHVSKAASVEVVMFHAREPGAAQAIDAAAYLKQHAM